MRNTLFTVLLFVSFATLIALVFYFYQLTENISDKKNQLEAEMININNNISSLEKNYAVLSRLDRLVKIAEIFEAEKVKLYMGPAKPSQIFLFDNLSQLNLSAYSFGLISSKNSETSKY